MDEPITVLHASIAPSPAPSWTVAPTPAVPHRVGPYSILRELGAGGMGVVYAAYHGGLDRCVALKLARYAANSAAGRRALLNEAQALARLSHPNIVQIHEVGEHEERMYVAMELVQGVTLAEWQRAPGRGLRERIDAYRQVALGLRAVHDAGLVHRDFKPANAIVGFDGRVRVLDFGLARTSPRADRASARAPARWPSSPTEAASGTPGYMSPEQYAGRELDARSDVFSLCAALWEALYDDRPFTGETYAELHASVIASSPPRIPARSEVPERLGRVLLRGLAVEPAERWATLDPVIAALSLDPASDPSVARHERAIFLAVSVGLNLGIVAPLLVFAASHPEIDRRVLALVPVGGSLLATVAVGVVHRRTLLQNIYYRRMLGFLLALMTVLAAHPAMALWYDAPPELSLIDGALVVAGMCTVGSMFATRWMAVPAGLAMSAVPLAIAAPELFLLAMAALGPGCMILFGCFWQRDARLGVERRVARRAARGTRDDRPPSARNKNRRAAAPGVVRRGSPDAGAGPRRLAVGRLRGCA